MRRCGYLFVDGAFEGLKRVYRVHVAAVAPGIFVVDFVVV